MKLHWQILIALLLALLVGLSIDQYTSIFGVSLISIFSFVGKLFLNALKMLIVPLIVSSIICGMVGVGQGGGVAKMGVQVIAYYMMTSLLAIIVGLLLVNMMTPGIVNGEPAKDIIGLSDNVEQITNKVEGRGAGDVAGVFLRMVPPNIVNAAADGQMLGLIFFSLLFGYFMMRLSPERTETQRSFWQGAFDIMMAITNLVMKFAPIGVFALVAKVVASTGLAAFEPLLVFFFTVLLALLVHILVTMPLLLKLLGGVSPIRHYKAMLPALLTAFSTSSSSATLPITMDCVEKNAGVSNKTSSFVLPLGATVNMDGTALYECVAAMFIAQAYGIDLGLTTQFTIVLVALLTSIGVAGIPSASLVAITIILAAVGLPAEAIGLILVVDRVLDMCRTSVNVFSDSCGAVIIAKRQGEKNILSA